MLQARIYVSLFPILHREFTFSGENRIFNIAVAVFTTHHAHTCFILGTEY